MAPSRSRTQRRLTTATSRKATRRRAAAGPQASDRPGRPSLLETRAVRLSTETSYRDALQKLIAFCRDNGMDWGTAESLDAIVTLFLTEMYLDGASYVMGARVVTALAHFLPATSRLGDWKLPRVARALKGWRVSTPASQRLPMPRAAALAIAGVMCAWGEPQMALWVALTITCYLRPSEAHKLQSHHIVEPSTAAGPEFSSWGLLLHDADVGIPGKTGILDDSVLIDLDPWILRPLAALKIASQHRGCVWAFSMDDLNQVFQRACTALGLGGISTHLYSLRHGGASHDLLARRRTPEQVQRRGRWQSAKSLRRYGKETRLLLEMSKVDQRVFDYGNRVLSSFADVIQYGPQALLGDPPLNLAADRQPNPKRMRSAPRRSARKPR